MKKNLLFFLFILVGCAFYKSPDTAKIKCIEAKYIFPSLSFIPSSNGYDTTYSKVYSCENFRIFELQYKYLNDENGHQYYSIRTHYIVTHIDSLYGYDFDKNKTPGYTRVRLDSVYANEWLMANKIYPILVSESSQVLSKRETLDSIYLHYLIRPKNDSVHINFLLTFAKRFNKSDVSLSKELDSIYQAKLVKSESEYVYFTTIKFPKMKVISSIREVEDFDKTLPKTFFDKYLSMR